MVQIMQKWKISAAQLAIGKDGAPVYSKSFGFADRERTRPVEPTNLFRIASCSKPITAVAVMLLIEQGKLSLDERALDILSDFKPDAKTFADPQMEQITVRQLLEHTSGFSNKNGDPQFVSLRVAAQAIHQLPPASAQAIIRYRLAKPLDRLPGTQYEYSNFGYNLLGRVIEKKTGEKYETFVQENLLKPAGITDMVIGKTRASAQLSNEVYYDDVGLGGQAWSIYNDEPQLVTISYGAGYSLEAMDSHGGWLATAEDLVKFIAATDGSNPKCQLLMPENLKIMTAPPEVTDPSRKDGYYAKGWSVSSKRDEWSHTGALTFGVASFICRLPNGIQIACVFNHLPENYPIFFSKLRKAIVPIVTAHKRDLY